MNRKKLIIGALIVVAGGALVAANVYFKREKGVEVQVEKIKKHDLESIVSASGKIQARTTVNISSQSMGRVTRLAVEEGDRVKQGQFLAAIDPRSLRSQVERGDAALAAQRTAVEQAKVQLEAARTSLKLAQDTYKRQQDLWKDQLTTKESLDRAENDVKVRQHDPLEEEIRSFVDAVVHRAAPRVSGLEARKSLELALLINEKMKTGRDLKL